MTVNALFKKETKKPVEIHNPQNLAELSAITKSIGRLQKEIDRPIWIENIDHVKGYLKSELKILATAIQGIVNAIKFPKAIEISNLEKYPDTFKIQELKQVIEAIHDLRAITSQLELNPTVNVEAPIIPEIKIPPIKIPKIYIPPAQVDVKPQDIEIDISGIISALKPLQLITDRATKPISVRLSDGRKFVEALKELVGKQEKFVTAFSTSKGMDEDEFKNKFTQLTQATTIISNRKTVAVAGTELQLIAASTPCFRVDVSADLANTNPVVVGGADVVAANDAQKGIVLIPGNAPFTIFIDNVNKLWVDSQTNGDSVCFNYFTR